MQGYTLHARCWAWRDYALAGLQWRRTSEYEVGKSRANYYLQGPTRIHEDKWNPHLKFTISTSSLCGWLQEKPMPLPWKCTHIQPRAWRSQRGTWQERELLLRTGSSPPPNKASHRSVMASVSYCHSRWPPDCKNGYFFNSTFQLSRICLYDIPQPGTTQARTYRQIQCLLS